MKKKRLIPVLLLRNGFLVQSKSFKRYKNLGNPITAVKRLSNWAADEIMYLNISRNDSYDMKRDDLGCHNRNNIVEIIRDISKESCMPITYGGRIRTLDDIGLFLINGADKVSINSMALERPEFIHEAAREFGTQCIVVSIDAKINDDRYEVMAEGGKKSTGYSPDNWAQIASEKGAGEILINSIDRDGLKQGYDLQLINLVADAVMIPVIACGGVGVWEDFAETLEGTKVDAVAAANIFHHYDQSVYLAKKYLIDRGCNVRPPDLILEKH